MALDCPGKTTGFGRESGVKPSVAIMLRLLRKAGISYQVHVERGEFPAR
jgi:hypothetical protein